MNSNNNNPIQSDSAQNSIPEFTTEQENKYLQENLIGKAVTEALATDSGMMIVFDDALMLRIQGGLIVWYDKTPTAKA